jgi:hypothetical protein
MRILLCSLFTVSMLAKSFFFFGWEIYFKMEQEQIAKEKCENKGKPMLHCNGKCYLAKQLKRIEQKENQHSQKTNPYCVKIDPWQNNSISPKYPILIASFEEIYCPTFSYSFSLAESDSFSIFHPPCTTV